MLKLKDFKAIGKLHIIILLFTLFSITTNAQSRLIVGVVTHQNNQPVWDVKVATCDTNIYVYTDIAGFFKIEVPNNCHELVLTKSGFAKLEVLLNGRTEINVKMELETIYELSIEDLLQTIVTTVSLKKQHITDAPGIISIITDDELKQMGIRTLREALLLIPGFMPLQNDDEQILAVRGIFATTNQKILVLRDGSPLNEGNLDIPQTEYSLSVKNIQKIEIIRGSGASIYGNSAFAAVVNIITGDTPGSEISAAVGNYGQVDINTISVIKHNSGLFKVWARYANANGQPFNVTVNNSQNKGIYKTFNYQHNYDIGFKYNIGKVTASVSKRKHTYYTFWDANGNYVNTDSLLKKPRLLQNSIDLSVNYEPEINDNLSLHFTHYTNYCQLNNLRHMPATLTGYEHGKGLQWSEWNVLKSALNYYATYTYSPNGQLLAGVTAENRSYLESWVVNNINNANTLEFLNTPFFPVGYEYRLAAYAQFQQNINNWFKIDLGTRFDYALHFKSSVNPRAALIATPIKPLTIKIMYTEAFQAPGYSYRTSNAAFSGSVTNLQPEKIRTLQYSVRYSLYQKTFIEVTAFNNHISNLITRTVNNYYENFSRYATYGFETEIQHTTNDYRFFINHTFLRPDINHSDSLFISRNISNKAFKNFPQNNINAGGVYNIKNKLDIAVNAQWASKFEASNNFKINNRLIINTTLTTKNLIKNTAMSISVYNLTNTKYYLGDPSVMPLLQPGSWFLATISYSFKPAEN